VALFESQNYLELASSRQPQPLFRRREGSPNREIREKEIPQPAEMRRLSG
jgi:hypothetical protein